MVSAGTENQKKEPTNPISKLSKQVQEDKWEIVQFQCRRKTKNHPQQRNKEPKSSTQRGPQQPSSYSLNVKLFQAHTSKFLDTQLFEYVEKSNRRLLPSIWLVSLKTHIFMMFFCRILFKLNKRLPLITLLLLWRKTLALGCPLFL